MIFINGLAVLVYLLSTIFLLKKQARYVTLFGYVSLIQFWTLISCFYNDLGGYNFELFRFTDPSYATTRLALFYLVFNFGFYLTARLIGHRSLTRRDISFKKIKLNFGNFMFLFYGGTVAFGGYLAYSLLSGDIPLFAGIDRVTFLRNATGIDRFLIAWGGVIAFCLGLFRRTDHRWSPTRLMFIGLFCYALLTGNKFSFLCNILIGYYTPIIMRYAAEHIDWRPLKLKYFAYAVVTSTAFLALAFTIYSNKMESIDGARELLTARVLGGQGEIWWAIDQQVMAPDGGYDSRHWRDELDMIIAPASTPGHHTGMRYLMVKILGAERAHAFFDGGYLFTMAYPAILTVTFPYFIALVAQLTAGGVFCLLLFYLAACITQRHHFRAIVTFLVALPFITVLFTGNFFVFFTLGMAVKLAVLLAMELVPIPESKSASALDPALKTC